MQTTIPEWSPLFSFAVALHRPPQNPRSPVEDELFQALRLGAETVGAHILASSDDEDFEVRLDEAVENPAYYRLNLLIARSLKDLPPVQPEDLQALEADVRAVLHEELVGAVTDIWERLGHINRAIRASPTLWTQVEAAAEQLFKKPLAFLEDPGFSAVEAAVVLNYLKADVCILALCHALPGKRRLDAWLAGTLVHRAWAGVKTYLRYLASIPDLQIPPEVVPIDERPDLRLIQARAAQAERGYQIAAIKAESEKTSVFPLFGVDEND